MSRLSDIHVFFEGTSCSGKSSLIKSLCEIYPEYFTLHSLDYVDLMKNNTDVKSKNVPNITSESKYLEKWRSKYNECKQRTNPNNGKIHLIDRCAEISVPLYNKIHCTSTNNIEQNARIFQETHSTSLENLYMNSIILVFINLLDDETFVQLTKQRGYFDANLVDLIGYKSKQNELYLKFYHENKNSNSRIYLMYLTNEHNWPFLINDVLIILKDLGYMC